MGASPGSPVPGRQLAAGGAAHLLGHRGRSAPPPQPSPAPSPTLPAPPPPGDASGPRPQRPADAALTRRKGRTAAMGSGGPGPHGRHRQVCAVRARKFGVGRDLRVGAERGAAAAPSVSPVPGAVRGDVAPVPLRAEP